MVVSVVASPAQSLHSPISFAIPSTEPPDRSILKEYSQLESCMLASKKWATLAETPELCKEASNNFNNPKRDNNGGIQKFDSKLKKKSKSSRNRHAHMIKESSQPPDITRAQSKDYVRSRCQTKPPTIPRQGARTVLR